MPAELWELFRYNRELLECLSMYSCSITRNGCRCQDFSVRPANKGADVAGLMKFIGLKNSESAVKYIDEGS